VDRFIANILQNIEVFGRKLDSLTVNIERPIKEKFRVCDFLILWNVEGKYNARN
jgi:hypothetical protein